MTDALDSLRAALAECRDALVRAETELATLERQPATTARLTLTLTEACDLLSVSRTTLYRLIRDGHIRKVAIGSKLSSHGQRLTGS